MDRHYKAFISYRHLPLDIRMAKKLQRRVERFVIPKTLRKNGEKKIGQVFRDQDELPISSDLSSEIENALDHSEYLVVICTPETQKSQWVLREITYFLEHHDRDHILTVLADGRPEESFPDVLTKVLDAEGRVIKETEPLAANIVAESEIKRDRLFQTESLRILAALIGCSYDDLYQREQRYRIKRFAVSFGTATVILLGFIGLLLNRNRLISEELSRSQANESLALAHLAESEYKEGQYKEAVEHLVQALPSPGNERPYIASAERVLGDVLHPYVTGKLQIDQSIAQETRIDAVAVSEDGQWVATRDPDNVIRCFSTVSGELKWETSLGKNDWESFFEVYRLEFINSLDAILIYSWTSAHLINLEDGSIRWNLAVDRVLDVDINRYELVTSFDDNGNDSGGVAIHSLKDGQIILSVFPEIGFSISGIESGCISADGRYLAMLCPMKNGGSFDANIQIYDREKQIIQTVESSECDTMLNKFDLIFAPDDSLIVIGRYHDEPTVVKRHSRGNGWPCLWRTTLEYEQFDPIFDEMQLEIRGDYQPDIHKATQHVSVRDGVVTLGNMRLWAQINLETGEINWSRKLHDILIGVDELTNGTFSLLMENGVVAIGLDNSYTGEEYGNSYFNSGMLIANGAQSGNSYGESVVVLVPNDCQNHMVIVRRAAASAVRPLDDCKFDSYMRYNCAVSPSGRYFAAISDADYDEKKKEMTLQVDFWDLETGKKEASHSVLCQENNMEYSWPVLTESGSFIFGSQVITKDGKESSLQTNLLNWEENTVIRAFSFKDVTANKLLTDVLWIGDGIQYTHLVEGTSPGATLQLPVDQETNYNFRESEIVMGGAGYSLVKLKKESYWKDESGIDPSECVLINTHEGTAEVLDGFTPGLLAMANQQPVIAGVFEGRLELYDCTRHERVLTFESAWQVYQYRTLVFSNDDKYLLAFSESGNMAVFDTETGGCVLKEIIGVIPSDGEYRLEAYQSSEDGRLLVHCATRDYGSNLLIIDLTSMEVVGVYPDIEGYCHETDEFLLASDSGECFLCKRYSMSELVGQAKEYLNR